MSSCRSCGSCTKYFETPSGKCDYCDCPYADHTSGAQFAAPSTPLRSQTLPAFNPMQNPMSPPQTMNFQQIPTNEMPFGQTGFPGPGQFNQMAVPMSPMSHMPQNPFMQQGQFSPGINQFYTQPPYQPQYTPYGGVMPMLPPNHQAAPYVGE